MTKEESNTLKIRFCNTMDRMTRHIKEQSCAKCAEYLKFGDGDLCDQGKQIVELYMFANHLEAWL